MKADTVRYGIIGTGLMGLEHLRNLAALPGAAVVAVADPHEASLAAARATAGDDVPLRCFADHRTLLDAASCDAVVVATPNMTHAAVLLDVLSAGLPVLVEKPLCTTMADGRRIAAAASGSPVLWVGLEYRYMPPIARLARSVHDGEIGRLRMVAIREHRYPFLPKIDDWNRFNRNTGGTLVEKCCHFFDLMNLLAGSKPVRTFASGAQDVNHLDESYDGQVPDILDNALIIVDYQNGIRASLDLCMFAEATTNQEELSVVGDAGKAEAFLPSGIFRCGRRHHGLGEVQEEIVHDPRIRHEGFHHGASYLEHLDFLDAVRNGRPPAVSVEDGILSVAMGIAAQRSIAEGRPIALDDVLNS